ncbi:polyprenyl synthetase family protein [Peribacillus glennii]|uniref:Farnesyl diphosphate synthase n=1 Tax=Peribacillus glennii TaxID=2303991 RepID=A0A372LH73_9BACI|nr:farnesyl diphosphate synthase [Peribacillus glennii]RFU65650.1 polyprenyl synthetase family protein [Peribacillus glennii]
MEKGGTLESFAAEHKKLLETALINYVGKIQAPDILKKAMVYSLEAGGKRIRPLLVFAVLSAFGKDTRLGIPAACAIEMIHTYSLIHDDLPSMDDDDLRRGKPTNHKVFGEANAILAGDALLTLSFQIIAQAAQPQVPAETALELIRELSKAAGAEGMVAGQAADIAGENKSLSLNELEYIHEHKTGKLLSISVLSGAILSGASYDQRRHLLQFSRDLGLAFQIRDDILDIEGTEEMIGKPVGSDAGNDKSTYPSLLTLDGAKQKLNEHIAQALAHLAKTNLDTGLLEEITNLIAARNH